MDTIETKLYYGILICCVLTGALFIFVFFHLIRRQRKFYREQRQYMLDTSAVIEQERKRIAHDLLDDLGPQFSIIFMQVSKIKSSNEADEELKQKALLHMRDAMEKLHFIAGNLTPRRFKEKGLQRSLEEYFKDYTAISPIRLSLVYEIVSALATEDALHLYRIVQELVHNAIKHSNAEKLNIHLKEKGRFIYLDYYDNGQGLMQGTTEQSFYKTSSTALPYAGIGLQSLQSRINLLGGRLWSKKGNGTLIFIELPKNFSG